MSRWIGFKKDPTAGGTTLDEMTKEVSPVAIPAPTIFLPATTGQADAGLNQLDRKNEVRGRRSDVAPISFAGAPQLTFSSRAYPKLLRTMLAYALGGTIAAPEGTSPAAITSKVTPLQSGTLPLLVAWLLREEQLDRLTGCAVSDIELDLPVDGEGTVSATLQALWHGASSNEGYKDPSGSAGVALPTPSYEGYEYTFMLRDVLAYRGPSVVEIPNLAGVKLGYNNGLIQDFRSRFKPGHNIEKTTIDSVVHKLWFPRWHKLGPQAITGTIDLSNVDASAEAKQIFTHAEKLVLKMTAGPLSTTPAADETLEIVLSKHVLTGGGAEPLVREGDQTASFTFTAYLDETTNKDIEAAFVGAAALTY